MCVFIVHVSGNLVELADLIKKEVFHTLKASETIPFVSEHLVGIHDRIEATMQLLDEGSPNPRFIVIHGIGGIRKTTFANCIFKKISSHFQGRCFFSDIRHSSVDDMVTCKGSYY